MIRTAPKYAELIYHHSKKKYYLHVVVEIKEREIEKGENVFSGRPWGNTSNGLF